MPDLLSTSASFSMASGAMPTDFAAAHTAYTEKLISLTAGTIPDLGYFFKSLRLFSTIKNPLHLQEIELEGNSLPTQLVGYQVNSWVEYEHYHTDAEETWWSQLPRELIQEAPCF